MTAKNSPVAILTGASSGGDQTLDGLACKAAVYLPQLFRSVWPWFQKKITKGYVTQTLADGLAGGGGAGRG